MISQAYYSRCLSYKRDVKLAIESGYNVNTPCTLFPLYLGFLILPFYKALSVLNLSCISAFLILFFKKACEILPLFIIIILYPETIQVIEYTFLQ